MQAIRSSYTLILKKYKKIGKGSVRLTQSSLFLVQPINATSETYKFPILESDNAIAPQPEEIRLNINDEFVSYNVSYYVLCDQTTGTDPIVQRGKFYLTYAPTELDISFGAINRAWDGFLQILVNKISRLEKWDLKKHMMIPWTQYQSISTALPIATLPSIDYSKDGAKAMQPMLTLSGAKKNDIIITLTNGAIPSTSFGNQVVPDQSAVGGTVTMKIAATRLGLFFRGMLAQNASKFQ